MFSLCPPLGRGTYQGQGEGGTYQGQGAGVPTLDGGGGVLTLGTGGLGTYLGWGKGTYGGEGTYPGQVIPRAVCLLRLPAGGFSCSLYIREKTNILVDFSRCHHHSRR